MKALFSFVVMIFLLLALGVVGFLRAHQTAKMAEVPENLRQLYEGAVNYAHRYLRGPTHQRLRTSFPASSGMTPESTCCVGTRVTPCVPGGRGPTGYNPEEWKKPPFVDFAFEIKDPHFFRYSFLSGVPAAEIPFEVSAYGDADCDGSLSRWYRKGVVREDFVGGPLEIFTEHPEE